MHHLPATNLQMVKTAILQSYINVSVLTLLVYEFFAVLQDEVRSIWASKLTAVTLLFFINRFVTLAYGVTSFLLMFTLKPMSCTVVTRTNEIITIILFFVFALFPSIRIYAIWQRNLSLAFVVFFFLIIQAGTNSYLYSIVTPVVLSSPKVVCVLDEHRVDIITKVVIGSRTVTIFADALVCVLTCVKTLGLSREAKALHLQRSITSLIVRQGILYFTVFLVLNVAQTVIQETTGIEYLSPYIFAITSILMTRFLLRLRGVDQKAGETAFSALPQSDVVFRRSRRRTATGQYITSFVGNFGEDLEFADDSVDDDDVVGEEGTDDESYALA